MAGALASAGSSLVLGVPFGPLIGAVVGPVVTSKLREVFADVAHRQLSDKERQRVRDVVWAAGDTIQRNIAVGRQPRADWYGSDWPDEPLPDDAAEISEGVLIAAQREHEDRKVAILGRILGNLAFSPKVDRAYANALIRIAQQLSYRQFCLLVLFDTTNGQTYDLAADLALDDGSGPLMGVLVEVYELYQRSMLEHVPKESQQSGVLELVISATSLSPARLRTLNGPGGWLLRLGELHATVPANDVQRVADLLGPPGSK